MPSFKSLTKGFALIPAELRPIRNLLEKPQLLVTEALCVYGPSAWPSRETLAQDTGLGVSTVRRTLDGLVFLGVLTKQSRPGTSDVYALGDGSETGGFSDKRRVDHILAALRHAQLRETLNRLTRPDKGRAPDPALVEQFRWDGASATEAPQERAEPVPASESHPEPAPVQEAQAAPERKQPDELAGWLKSVQPPINNVDAIRRAAKKHGFSLEQLQACYARLAADPETVDVPARFYNAVVKNGDLSLGAKPEMSEAEKDLRNMMGRYLFNMLPQFKEPWRSQVVNKYMPKMLAWWVWFQDPETKALVREHTREFTNRHGDVSRTFAPTRFFLFKYLQENLRDAIDGVYTTPDDDENDEDIVRARVPGAQVKVQLERLLEKLPGREKYQAMLLESVEQTKQRIAEHEEYVRECAEIDARVAKEREEREKAERERAERKAQDMLEQARKEEAMRAERRARIEEAVRTGRFTLKPGEMLDDTGVLLRFAVEEAKAARLAQLGQTVAVA